MTPLTELKLMATNTRWSDRQVFVQMCAACVGVVDSHIVIEEFVPLMLMAAEDTVPNVRRELARALVVFQSDALYAVCLIFVTRCGRFGVTQTRTSRRWRGDAYLTIVGTGEGSKPRD